MLLLSCHGIAPFFSHVTSSFWPQGLVGFIPFFFSSLFFFFPHSTLFLPGWNHNDVGGVPQIYQCSPIRNSLPGCFLYYFTASLPPFLLILSLKSFLGTTHWAGGLHPSGMFIALLHLDCVWKAARRSPYQGPHLSSSFSSKSPLPSVSRCYTVSNVGCRALRPCVFSVSRVYTGLRL